MFQFDFTKIHGSGNDFIVVDNRNHNERKWTQDFVNHICRPHTGIGADGLLLLEEDKQADYRMRFFNSDGPEAEMCANGSRCLSYFAYKNGIAEKKMTFMAQDGIHQAEIIAERVVRVQVNIRDDQDERTFPDGFLLPDDCRFTGFLNTGVPHLILQVEDVQNIDVATLGKALRFHKYFQPQGTNVNFVQIDRQSDPPILYVRTYERGVDAETLSCGSGVTAAAIVMRNKYFQHIQKMQIETSGGLLSVDFTNEEKFVFLQGPVKVIFKGTYIEEDGP